MNKLILTLFLVIISPLVLAQNEFNFETIDIFKDGDTSVRNFTSGNDNYIFLANNKLVKLNKETKQYSFINTGSNNLSHLTLISDGENHFFYNTNGNTLLKYVGDGQLDTIKTAFSLNKIIKIDNNLSYILYSDSYNSRNPRLAKISNGVFEDVLNLETDSELIGISIQNNKAIILYVNKISIVNLSNNEVLNFAIENMMNYGYQNYKLDIVDSKLYFKSTVNYRTTVKYFNLNTYDFQDTILPNYTLGSIKKIGETIVYIFNNDLYKIDSNGTTSRIDLRNYTLYNSTLDISYNNFLFTSAFVNQTGVEETLKIDISTGEIQPISFLNNSSFFENNLFEHKQYYIKGKKLEVYNFSNDERQVLSSTIDVEKILSVTNDEIILHASTLVNGAEIFAYNNRSASVEYFGDLNNLPNTNPGEFHHIGDKVFYQALSSSGHYNLFVSQGTEETTKKIYDIALNDDTSERAMYGIGFKNKLYFSGTSRETNSGRELWFSDGTTEGTQEIVINPITAGNLSNRSGFIRFIEKGINRFYFIGYTPHQGEELWTSDGTRDGTHIVKDFSPGSNSTYYPPMVNSVVGDNLYFLRPNYSDYDNYVYFDLWITDGSEQGTRRINTITEVVHSDSYSNQGIISATENYVYYTYYYSPINDDNYHEVRLYRYNLQTTQIELIDNVKSRNSTVLVNENIYYTKNNNYYRYNIHTGVKILIEEDFLPLRDNMLVLRDCGKYLLYGDSGYQTNFSNLRVWNKSTQELIFYFDSSNGFSEASTMCINDTPILFATNHLENPNIPRSYFQIVNDEIREIAIKIDNENIIPQNYLGEFSYNPQLNKIFGNSYFRHNGISELIVSNVDFLFLNTTENLPNDNSIKKKNIIVFPNPAYNKINVKIIKGIIHGYSLHDILGKEIRKESIADQSQISINLSNFPKGLYILNLITSEGKKSKQIIIK